MDHRAYQDRAIEAARDLARRKVRRFIFQCPTGGGKTILSGMVTKGAVERGRRIVFAAHRRELIIQPFKKFALMGIPPSKMGVIKAGEERLRNDGAPIQIVSIQSVYRRQLPAADIVFIDECHLARAQMFEWLIDQYPNATIIGLTATACRLDNKPLRSVFDEIVVVATPSELIAGGYIVPPRIVTVPDSELPDLSDVRRSGHDYNEEDLGRAVGSRTVMGSIPRHWAEQARGLRTMLFACTIEHSKNLVDLLVGAGIRAVHVDGNSSKQVRDQALVDLEAGRIDIVSQVGLWIEGLDMPSLKCAIMARPTESLVIHCQTTGRIMRPWNDIQPLLLDHAGNCKPERLGVPYRDIEYSLDAEPRTAVEQHLDAPFDPHDKVVTCRQCSAEYPVGTKQCGSCGIDLGGRVIHHAEDVELVALDTGYSTREPSEEAKRHAFERFWEIAYRDGYAADWVARQYQERFMAAPPPGWPVPARPDIQYTREDRQSERVRLYAIADRQGLDHAWVAKRYEAKFAEPMGPETRPEKTATTTPAVFHDEIVDLEF